MSLIDYQIRIPIDAHKSAPFPLFPLLIPIFILVSLCVIYYLWLFKTSSKFRSRSLRVRIALITGLGHFTVTAAVCLWVAILMLTRNDSMSAIAYVYLYLLDYPLLPILFVVMFTLGHMPKSLLLIVAPLISLSILGSLVYGYLAFFIGYLLGKIKEQFK